MPQSEAFWQHAREMRQYEYETPEEQRVYLCIFHLNKSRIAQNEKLKRMMEGRSPESEIALQDVLDDVGVPASSYDSSPVFAQGSSQTTNSWTDHQSAATAPRGKLRKPTEEDGRRLAIKLNVPKVVKFWNEIGTVDRHWAVEVRQKFYELMRERNGNKDGSRFQCLPVAAEQDRRNRLTARIFAGATHMTDKVLLELAKGVISLQQDYELHMDNCQHFAAVFLPRILCCICRHMKDLPNASLPFLKHTEFWFEPGLTEGRVSRIYHRFLHENITKSWVWQESIYYFRLHESEEVVTTCKTIEHNPYRAATRLSKGNWIGRTMAADQGVFERQTTVRWDKVEHTSRLATEQESKAWFPNACYPSRQSNKSALVRNWVTDFTAAMAWTPRVFDEWIMTDDPEINLVIPFPNSYFRKEQTFRTSDYSSSPSTPACVPSAAQSSAFKIPDCLRLSRSAGSLQAPSSPGSGSEASSRSCSRSWLGIPGLRPKTSSLSLISSSYCDSNPETRQSDVLDAPEYAQHVASDEISADVLSDGSHTGESWDQPFTTSTDEPPSYADIEFLTPAHTRPHMQGHTVGPRAPLAAPLSTAPTNRDMRPEDFEDDLALARGLQESLELGMHSQKRQVGDDEDMARALSQEWSELDMRFRLQQCHEDEDLARGLQQSLAVRG